MAAPLAQSFAVVTAGAASGRPFSARDVLASSGYWAEQDILLELALNWFGDFISPGVGWGMCDSCPLGAPWCQAL